MKRSLAAALSRARALVGDARGGVAVICGLSLPVLGLVVGGAVELAEVVRARSSLQRTVDDAALSGGKQLATDRSSATADRTKSLADTMATVLAPRWSVNTTVRIDANARTVTVSQVGDRASLFGSFLPPWTISVKATARQLAQAPLCVLTSQSGGSRVLHLLNLSRVTASNCLVQSNSDIVVDTAAALQAGSAQSVGASTGTISPAPTTYGPPMTDPFSGLNITVPAICNDNGITATGGGTVTINPGVHCGDIDIGGMVNVILNPGEHYFVNGPISIKGIARMTGNDVVLIFKGSASIQFSGKASISLEGRQSGPYAGFVMITDRSLTGTLAISTDSAHLLHGTIYLPQASLDVTGSGSKVADQSPWTIAVAKQMSVSGSADLVINSNYGGSSIPVPTGGGPLRLTQ